MKKTVIIALICLIMLSLAVGCNKAAPTGSNADTVVIGVYEPASGDNGPGGKQETLGIQYANSITPTVEIGGKTYNVELSIVDNQSSNDKAVSAAQQLIAANSSVILGSYGSGVSMAASETFRDAGLAAIGVSCTNPNVTADNSHYFRICFLDPFQGTVLSSFAKKQFGATKAYCLAKLGDDYSVGLVHYFMQAFGEGNCVSEQFPDGTSDFSTYVANAKAQGCDVFFSPTSIEAAQLIIDQIATQGGDIPILAGDTWDAPQILQAAKGKNVEIFVTTFYQEGGSPDFDRGFKAWLNNNSTALTNNGGTDTIGAVSALGHDAYYVALEALKKAGSIDKAEVLAILPSVTFSGGATGNIAFDDVGDAFRNSAFVKKCDTATGDWIFVVEQNI
ncbi:MAG: ABC transporter substrate-binding protein [Clostridiales bacterium]|nr:ABC transporter substrate-binding protein [Clostridiales bacterium]